MSGIKISNFSGIAPKVQPTDLPINMGQIANNCRIISGSLMAFKSPLKVTTNTLQTGGDIKTLFRMNDGANDYWLSWLKDVDCVRGQIAGDTSQRIYWTGDNEPRMSNLATATASNPAPAAGYVLGVAAPAVKLVPNPTGGSGTAAVRAYVETFVTQFGEESAPSPVSDVFTAYVNSTWTIPLSTAPINSSTITGALYSSGVVNITTTSSRHLRAGEEITISGVVGMTDLNATHIIKSVVDATHFTVALTTAQTYTSGGTWTRKYPHNITNMTRRLYRTFNGRYYLVNTTGDIPIGTTSYTDTTLDQFLGEEIKSKEYFMPPTTMKGMCAHPNGFMVGFDGNEILFSEQWQPHAYPLSYRLACNFDIVGIKITGSTIVVATTGKPYVVTGSDPSQMSMNDTQVIAPCVSKRSMVDLGHGIAYASMRGLEYVSASGSDLATKDLYTRLEWADVNPSTLICAVYDEDIIGFHNNNGDGYSGFVFNMRSGVFSTLSLIATAAYTDFMTGSLYFVSGNLIYKFAEHPFQTLTYDWKSKIFLSSKKINYGYGKVSGDFVGVDKLAEIIAANIANNNAILASGATDGMLGDVMLDEYTVDGSLLAGGGDESDHKYASVTIYADGVEKYTENVLNDRSFSLPSGFKSSNHEFRISGNINLSYVAFVESASELKGMQ